LTASLTLSAGSQQFGLTNKASAPHSKKCLTYREAVGYFD